MWQAIIDFATSSFGQAVGIAIATAIIGRFVTARSKLVWAVSHQHLYQMPRLDDDGSFPVTTQQVWLQNTGRVPAEDVEVVLNWKPQHLEVWEPRNYVSANLPDGRFALVFPYITGGEVVILSMIDTIREIPAIISIRSKSGLGTMVAMAPQRVWSNWIIYPTLIVTMMGFTSVVYLILGGVSKMYSNYVAII